MGDVYDVMKRSGNQNTPADDRSTLAPDNERPGLPIEDVQVQSLCESDSESGRTTTTAATPKHEQEAAGVSVAVDGPPKAASLNGYAEPIVVHHDRGSVITEQYRAIRTQILAQQRKRRLQTHVITSSEPEEGKSVTTVNLGICFTELTEHRTLVIEGDLRRPSFSRLFNRETELGLSQYLSGQINDIGPALYPTVYDNLQILPAGDSQGANSTELLSSPRLAKLIDRLRVRYDHIFVDSPPVITVTDACILGAVCDQTLLVVRLKKTPVELIERTKRLLRAADCELAGVILTHAGHEIFGYKYQPVYEQAEGK